MRLARARAVTGSVRHGADEDMHAGQRRIPIGSLCSSFPRTPPPPTRRESCSTCSRTTRRRITWAGKSCCTWRTDVGTSSTGRVNAKVGGHRFIADAAFFSRAHIMLSCLAARRAGHPRLVQAVTKQCNVKQYRWTAEQTKRQLERQYAEPEAARKSVRDADGVPHARGVCSFFMARYRRTKLLIEEQLTAGQRNSLATGNSLMRDKRKQGLVSIPFPHPENEG